MRIKLILIAIIATGILALAGCGTLTPATGGPDDDTGEETTPYAASGLVTLDGEGLEGVTLSFSGGFAAVTTDANGAWSIEGLSGTVTITPAMRGCAFTPASVTVDAARDHVDFAVAGRWEIVGGAGFSVGRAEYISLALDSAGVPYVAFTDNGASQKAVVKKLGSSGWETAGGAYASDWGGFFASMALKNSSMPCVAFLDVKNGMKATVKECTAAGWTAVSGVGFSAGLNLENSLAYYDGTPYLAYRDEANGGKVTVMQHTGGGTTGWEPLGAAGFSEGEVWYVSLAFDGDGVAYVAYQDGDVTGKATVMWYDSEKKAWLPVGDVRFSAGAATSVSLVFGGDGAPYVAYRDGGNGGRVTVMRFDGEKWEPLGTAGFSAGSANFVSLAFAGDGAPYVAYAEAALDSQATVMRFNGSQWEIVGAASFTADNADFLRLAIDGDGVPYVAFQDWANGYRATVMKYVAH